VSGTRKLDKATEHLRRKYGEFKGVSICPAGISGEKKIRRSNSGGLEVEMAKVAIYLRCSTE